MELNPSSTTFKALANSTGTKNHPRPANPDPRPGISETWGEAG